MQDNSNSRWAELISKLIALTQDDVLKWTKSESNQSGSIFIVKSERFIASYNGKKLILSSTFAGVGQKQYKLEIAGEDGVSLYEIPTTSGIKDLYDAVSYCASGVKQFIDDLLK